LVPSQDGAELYVGLKDLSPSCGTVCVIPSQDSGFWLDHDQRCCTTPPCIITLFGLPPELDVSSSFFISSTLNLHTIVDFVRAYVPAFSSRTIHSSDGNLQLTLINNDTLDSDAYVAIAPTNVPTYSVPPGHRLLNPTYNVRASGARLATDKPFSLRFTYNTITLDGADPHMLAIFAWDSYQRAWHNVGGLLFSDQSHLVTATSRFTTYALMVTPSWRDAFADHSGLDLTDQKNVTLYGTPDNRAIVLERAPGIGCSLSQPITSTTAASRWNSLTFSHTIDPPTLTLTIDVLSSDGTTLLTDVASGVSLTGLSTHQYPALVLKANLSSTEANRTPALHNWQVTWQLDHKVYLPTILR
jgi:hypothetical protein